MNKVAALAIGKIGTLITSRESTPKSLGLIRRSRRTKCGGASYSDRHLAGLSERDKTLMASPDQERRMVPYFDCLPPEKPH